ncbi:MAG: FtsQ-type POTRA domain-containing protein, partial [Candidatus Hydrogenedentes bacterium]|nr:FtsQ-type POTRA domain-containing protein [Candidatus Hydrogenedentota bacterium]
MPRAAALRIKDQRIARRATGRSFRTAFVTVFMLGTMSCAAFAFYQYADQSDYFRVKTIQIDGAELLKAEDIAALSGVSNEDNILFVRPSVVKSRIETNPYIAQCTVTRTFPDLVRISIDE